MSVIIPLAEFELYGETFYVITPDHTTQDILRFMISECGGPGELRDECEIAIREFEQEEDESI